MNAACGFPLEWRGCYTGLTALWVDDAYSHPAKAHPSLAFRILRHLEELGLLKEGDTVLDPMAGTGTFGLAWAVLGGQAILVELEPKFIALCEANKAELERTLGHPVGITILQGDSRRLSELLTERGLVRVTSPPYGLGIGIGQSGQEQGETYLEAMATVFQECAKVCDVLVSVSKDPTRNGKLRPLARDLQTLLEAADFRILCHHRAILFEEQTQGHLFEGSKKKVKGRMSFFKRLQWQKGKSEIAAYEDILVAVRDNPGGMKVVTSAPYGAGTILGGQTPEEIIAKTPSLKGRNPGGHWFQALTKGYGSTPGQIGALPDRPLHPMETGDVSLVKPFPDDHPADVLP